MLSCKICLLQNFLESNHLSLLLLVLYFTFKKTHFISYFLVYYWHILSSLSLLPLKINKYSFTAHNHPHRLSRNYHKYHIEKEISAVFSRHRRHPLTRLIVRGRRIPLHHGSQRVHRHDVNIELPLLGTPPAQAVVWGRREVVIGGGRSFRYDRGHGGDGRARIGGAGSAALAATPFRAWDDEEEGDQAAERGDVPDHGPGVQGRLFLGRDLWMSTWKRLQSFIRNWIITNTSWA